MNGIGWDKSLRFGFELCVGPLSHPFASKAKKTKSSGQRWKNRILTGFMRSKNVICIEAHPGSPPDKKAIYALI